MSLEEDILKKVMLLDGAMGTLLSHHLGKLETLDEVSIISPVEVEQIHLDYSMAGADIFKTNTFNNSPHTQKAVELAKNALFRNDQYIAGVIGPILYQNPLEKIIDDFNDSKVDCLLLETCMSLEDTKERIEVIKKRSSLPILVSITLKQDGTSLDGNSAQYFFDTVSQLDIFSFGFNCSFGPQSITKVAMNLKNPLNIPLSAHPNMKDKKSFLEEIKMWINEDIFKMIGGCCGTTPDEIKKLRSIIP